MARIELNKASLHFKVRRSGSVAFKDYVVKRLFSRSKNPYQTIEALTDVDLQVDDGERIGVVGHNGAGKSTLLRMLTGIYPPTSGSLRVQGRVSSLLELGTGMELEATGWDNIAIRGRLEGFRPDEVEAGKHDIAAFSELGDRLNLPVRLYSSGMRVRLLFSLATAIDPEILLIDEVLSTGDAAFYEKAQRRISRLIQRSRILILTTHDLEAIKAYCNRVLWMVQGRIHEDGKPHEVVDRYQRYMHGLAQAA